MSRTVADAQGREWIVRQVGIGSTEAEHDVSGLRTRAPADRAYVEATSGRERVRFSLTAAWDSIPAHELAAMASDALRALSQRRAE